ncbi:MAG: CHAT domain-containing protein [Candidatus Hodarchaeales archaeon]
MIKLSDIKKLNNKNFVDKYINSHHNGSVEDFISAINNSVNQLLAKDIVKAEAFIDALQLSIRFLPSQFKPNLIAIRARLNHWKGCHLEALRGYRKSIEEFRKLRNYRSVAITGQGLMDVLMYLGRYEDALATGKKSLTYFRKKNMQPNIAKVLTNIGNIYHRLDRNKLALSYYDKARTLFESKGGVALATVDFNRANIFSNLNKLSTAAQLYKSSAEIYRNAGLQLYESKAKYSIAYLLFLGDKYSRALEMFEEVYAAFLKLGDHKAAAITQLDLVECNIHLNQLSASIHLGEDVIKQFKKFGMRYELAKATYFVAITHLKLGELQLAAKYLRISEKLYLNENNHLWLGMIYLAKAKLSLKKRNTMSALEASLQAKELFIKSKDKRRCIDADILIVKLLFRNKEIKRAHQVTKSLLKKRLVGYQIYDLYTILGQFHIQNNQKPEALKHFKVAVETLEKMVNGLYPDEIRFFFLLDKLEAYQGVVDSLMELSHYEMAFLNNLRTLSIVNARHRLKKVNLKKIPKKLLEARSTLRTSLKKLAVTSEENLRNFASTDMFYNTEQKLWSVERRIRTYSSSHIPNQSRGVEFNSISELLRSDESIINYHITGEREIIAFCANRKKVISKRLNITFEELRKIVWELQFVSERAIFGIKDIQSSIDTQKYYLRKLYHILIESLEQEITNNKLIIVSDGIFAQIPFMSLINREGKYLKDIFKISNVISPSDLRNRSSKTVPFKKMHNAIFGVPSETIPAVTMEVNKIDSYFDSHLFIGKNANRENLKTHLLSSNGFVHIAVHASRSSENPLFSQIFMSDGPFYPFDLFATGIKAQLVTLSGCQTASPGLYYGDSFSLAKAFHQAGSRFVIGSLWPLSDKPSAAFMIFFYESLAKTGDVNKAFNLAMNKLAEISSNPALWSAFILLGV